MIRSFTKVATFAALILGLAVPAFADAPWERRQPRGYNADRAAQAQAAQTFIAPMDAKPSAAIRSLSTLRGTTDTRRTLP